MPLAKLWPPSCMDLRRAWACRRTLLGPQSLASWNIEILREILIPDRLQTEPRSPEDHLVSLVSSVREWVSESPIEDDNFDLDWLFRRPWRIWNGPLHPMLALDIQSVLFRKGIG